MSDVFREGSPLDKHRGQESITDFDRKVHESMRKVLWIPDEFKEYMTQYQALNQPPIPIGQIFGFALGVPQSAEYTGASENTTSATYVDLATAGPTITGLPDGVYLISHGCRARVDTAGNTAVQSISLNAAAASDTNAAMSSVDQLVSVSRTVAETLDGGGNNSIALKYRVSAGTGTFDMRWIVATRITSV